jgi:biopolymer transport protein TolR
MTRLSYRRRRRRIAEMNVVPYIDVMLVLLIIFMITSPLLTEGVKVELPKTNTKTEAFSAEGNVVIVTINTEGEIFLQNDDYAVSEAMLVDRVTALAEQGKKLEVFVKGDRNALYGRVTEVMALLKAAKIARVSLVTERR